MRWLVLILSGAFARRAARRGASRGLGSQGLTSRGAGPRLSLRRRRAGPGLTRTHTRCGAWATPWRRGSGTGNS